METIDNNEIIETFDLEAELAKPTQTRSFDFSNQPDVVEEILNETQDDKSKFNDNFDTEKLKEIAQEKVADNFEALYETSTLAPAIVDGADAIMQQVFPILYEKSAFNAEQIKIIKVLAHKNKNQKETILTEDDLTLQAACSEYEAYIQSLPLTGNEKKQIIKPLSELLKDVNFQTSPTNAFIIAILLVMLPRLLPIGINKFIKNKD